MLQSYGHGSGHPDFRKFGDGLGLTQMPDRTVFAGQSGVAVSGGGGGFGLAQMPDTPDEGDNIRQNLRERMTEIAAQMADTMDTLRTISSAIGVPPQGPLQNSDVAGKTDAGTTPSLADQIKRCADWTQRISEMAARIAGTV